MSIYSPTLFFAGRKTVMSKEVALLVVCGYIFREQQSKEAYVKMHEQRACPLEPLWVMQKRWSEVRQAGIQDLKIQQVQSGIQTLT